VTKNPEKMFYETAADSSFTDQCKKTNNLYNAAVNNNYRKLKPDEIEILENQGNQSEDWNKILVCSDFSTENILGCRFNGRCILGKFSGEKIKITDITELKTGIYNSDLTDTFVDSEACVYKNGMISNTFIAKNSVIAFCKLIENSGSNTFGNGTDIKIGNEISLKSIPIFADMTCETAGLILADRSNNKLLSRLNNQAREYNEKIQLPFGVVSENSVVAYCKKISSSFIGPFARLYGADLTDNSSIISNKENPVVIGEGVIIKNCIIKNGACIDSHSIVKNSFIDKNVKLAQNAQITDSIIGQGSVIEKGEITSSFTGPLTSSHHQSMLISAIWPGGRGNIGYGANIGSNHTGKAPDQEIICGEGMFFGLGVNIKYPADFSGAPYTIIATGVTTLPQKLTFPFSLIDRPHKNMPVDFPSGLNELFPAWMLYNNVYGVFRNIYKYKDRLKSGIKKEDLRVFRPEIIKMMIKARDSLRSIPQKDICFESDIKGIGKNFIRQENIQTAIESYSFFIKYYALKGVIENVVSLIEKGDNIAELFAEKTAIPEWDFQKKILETEGVPTDKLKSLAIMFMGMRGKILKKAVENKNRDNIRYMKIFPENFQDMESYNPEQDPVLLRIKYDTENYLKITEKITGKLSQ